MATENSMKLLDCYMCKKPYSIVAESFPEDLYDLMKNYSENQLIWLCKICKVKADVAFRFLTVVDQQKYFYHQLSDFKSTSTEQQKCLEIQITELKNTVNITSLSLDQLRDDVRRLSLEFENKTCHNRSCVSSDVEESHLSLDLGFKKNSNHTDEKFLRSYSSTTSDSSMSDSIEGTQNCPVRKSNLNGAKLPTKSSNSFSVNHGTESIPHSSHQYESSQNGLNLTKKHEKLENDTPPIPTADERAAISANESKLPITKIKAIIKEQIKIGENENKNSRSIVNNFMEKLTSCMKNNDEEFKCLFEKCHYTGSSYEGLRISSATEFDVNIVLKFPSKEGAVIKKCEFFKQTKTFAKLKCQAASHVTSGNENGKIMEKFLKTNSEGHYLVAAKMHGWMQRIIEKTLKNNKEIFVQDGIRNICNHQSGPAQTITFDCDYTDNNGQSRAYSIAIDLVPVFQFGFPSKDEFGIVKYFLGDHDMMNKVADDHRFLFLVPKPCDGIKSMYSIDCKISWRINLPMFEKRLIHDMACVKPIIKLLKLLRDKWNLKQLASYYLKTVLMWEVKQNPTYSYWAEEFLLDRFLEALQKLANYMKEETLPYYYDPEYNLFHKLKSDFCSNCFHRLTKMHENIKKNPLSIDTYFRTVI